MTQAIQSANVSSAHTKSFNKVVSRNDTVTEATSQVHCQVYNLENYIAPKAQAPAKHTAIDSLIGQWEKDDKRRAALEEARQWVADTLHVEDGDTVRTIRLRKGWSQTRLATEISTSQSHVARIERGTENLAVGTCRKLCSALEIDMNALDKALRHQEALAQAKQK